MADLIHRIRTAAEKRARYRRTLSELQRTNIDVQLDLELYQQDFRRIAREAVYG